MRAVLLLTLLFVPIFMLRAATLRTDTITISYAPDDIYPGRLANAAIALTQMQHYFDTVQLAPNTTCSFAHDLLGNSLPRSLGYVTTERGYADGISDAASALNTLIHRTFYWDANGIQRPLFLEVASTRIKNDRTFGDYAVSILFDGGNSTDYTWRLNPSYHGSPPRITSRIDSTTATITLSVTFSDEITPPTFATDQDRFASLGRTLAALIGEHRIGVTLIDVHSGGELLNINGDAQVPIASAWKGAGAVYFFEHVDPAIWRSVPIKYWNVKQVTGIPPEYQQTWLKYHQILRDAYVMTVFSGNHEAANTLAYVYRSTPSLQQRTSNPIRAFNDWLQTIGVSTDSGLYNWDYGDLENPGITDPRFLDRRITLNGVPIFFANTFDSHDLARVYQHLATVGRPRGYYDAAVELLSIRTPIISKIEAQVLSGLIHTATKDGYFGPESPNSMGHDVNNDAGLLIFPDGREYAVAFTAFDAVPLESDVVGLVIRALIR